ncbi:hypothetical protein BH09ACT8_BH09ACT8_37300 [soil metagenome]
MCALLQMHPTFDGLGWYCYPGQPNLLMLSVIQLLLMIVMVGMLFLTLRPLENNPLPGWDGPVAVEPGARRPWRGRCCAWRVRHWSAPGCSAGHRVRTHCDGHSNVVALSSD